METIINEDFATLTGRLEILRKTSLYKYVEVERLWSQASGYVWGWQDAGGSPRDSEISWNFGLAYAWHAYKFATEATYFRRSIQDAFTRWTETGRIEG